MEIPDGRYYAFHFDDVSAAVDYCGALVPHVVSRLLIGEGDGVEESPAIWFHAAPRSSDGRAGCDLLMTRGAILAAVAGGLETPRIGPGMRAALPPGSVLVLGEDSHEPPIVPRTRRSIPAMHVPNRLSQRSA
jgi:hypothetical protein